MHFSSQPLHQTREKCVASPSRASAAASERRCGTPSTSLYGVPDLASFLEAALLLPASVTADFNFPEWNYFGRGPARGVPVASSR